MRRQDTGSILETTAKHGGKMSARAPCFCKTSWSNVDCTDQQGCPAEACDGTAGRWCEVDPLECSSAIKYRDYHYIVCGDENQMGQNEMGGGNQMGQNQMGGGNQMRENQMGGGNQMGQNQMGGGNQMGQNQMGGGNDGSPMDGSPMDGSTAKHGGKMSTKPSVKKTTNHGAQVTTATFTPKPVSKVLATTTRAPPKPDMKFAKPKP